MFTLDQIVPWGRSFDEYRRMFVLRDRELNLRILGCGDGPANFNAEATRRGLSVTSCDPLYRWDAAQIRDRIAQLGEEFHRAAIREMCRVAAEVRIFPLLTLGGTRSPLVDPIAGELAGSGFAVSIQSAPSEFQRGGNEMMVIRHEQEQCKSPQAPPLTIAHCRCGAGYVRSKPWASRRWSTSGRRRRTLSISQASRFAERHTRLRNGTESLLS